MEELRKEGMKERRKFLPNQICDVFLFNQQIKLSENVNLVV